MKIVVGDKWRLFSGCDLVAGVKSEVEEVEEVLREQSRAKVGKVEESVRMLQTELEGGRSIHNSSGEFPIRQGVTKNHSVFFCDKKQVFFWSENTVVSPFFSLKWKMEKDLIGGGRRLWKMPYLFSIFHKFRSYFQI